MTKKITYSLILMIAACGLLNAETRLVSADAFSAVIEYTMEQPEFKTNADGEQTVFLPGCQAAGQPGAPATLESSFSLGVPEGVRVKVQILTVESEDIRNFLLAPIPALVSSEQPGLGSYRYAKNPSHYGKAGMLPGTIASLASVERLRQYNIAGVKMIPVQYDPLAGVLRLNKRITVQVSWDIAGRENDSRPDPAFAPVFSKLLVNYPQCRNWKVSEKTSKAKAVDPFDGHSVWYKLSVLQEGIYRLDYDYLLRNGIDPAVIDPRTIKIFSGGSAALPKDRNIVVPDTMKQIAIWIKGQEDGRFDQGDHIIFYGQDLSGWDKNSKLTTPQFFNPYADTNCYWLTWGGDNGRRMPARNCEPSPENLQPLQSFTDTLHFEQDKFNPFNSGEFYYWANMRRASSESSKRYNYEINVPYPANSQANVYLTVHAGINSKHRIKWGLNGIAAKELFWTGGPELLSQYEITDSLLVANLSTASNILNVELIKENADSIDAIYLNWVEIIYYHKYQAYKGALKFRADSTGQIVNRFYLTGLNSDTCLLLDISNPEAPNHLLSSNTYPAYVRFDDGWKRGNRYFAAAPSAWFKPARMEAYNPNRLRELCADVKYLMIVADQLWAQAQVLLAHHVGNPEKQPARAVKLSWINNEFGFGVNDPAAIRNFLKYIYTNSGGTSPVWCVLFGNGNYDYRHIDRSIANTNLVPTHQEDRLNFVLEEYQFHSYDDWYAYFTTGLYPQFSIARLPAANSEEAWSVVNKTINYDSPKTLASWRSQTILVADDLTPDGSTHMNAAENLYYKTPGCYIAEKVYGVQYDLDSNHHKPGARSDLIKYWNGGAGIVNFVGHGAWWTWGHEWYFRDTDVSYLANGSKLPLVITASCGVSRFDNPYYKCINSLVVTKASGGAIASFGSTREGYGTANNNLNYNLYSSLFDSLLDMGRSVWVAKIASNNPSNNQCYTLLGDPGIKFSQPQNPIDIIISSDTLYNQGRYNISGVVEASSNFSGRVMLELRDIPHLNTDFNYLLPGNIIFRGEFPVANDSFQMIVNIPDQLHIGPVSGAKVRAYAWNSSVDAAGVTADTIWIGGIDPDPDTTYQDTSAPKIAVYAGGLALKQDDYLPSQSKFRVEISDRSGINIAPGVSKYGEIKFTIIKDGKQLVSTDIAKDFIYSLSNDTLTSGAADYAYNFSSSGKYTVRVEAYDTRLRKGLWENAVNVETDLKVSSIYNFPNPLKDDTYFTFMLSQPGDVAIRIFTVAGNLIREILANSLNAGYNQVYWNGRDDKGSIPANGVYLYKVTARDDGLENSGFGKLVIMR